MEIIIFLMVTYINNLKTISETLMYTVIGV